MSSRRFLVVACAAEGSTGVELRNSPLSRGVCAGQRCWWGGRRSSPGGEQHVHSAEPTHGRTPPISPRCSGAMSCKRFGCAMSARPRRLPGSCSRGV